MQKSEEGDLDAVEAAVRLHAEGAPGAGLLDVDELHGGQGRQVELRLVRGLGRAHERVEAGAVARPGPARMQLLDTRRGNAATGCCAQVANTMVAAMRASDRYVEAAPAPTPLTPRFVETATDAELSAALRADVAARVYIHFVSSMRSLDVCFFGGRFLDTHRGVVHTGGRARRA